MEFYDIPISELAARNMLQLQVLNNLQEKTPILVQNVPIDQTPNSFPWKTFLIIGTAFSVTLILLNKLNRTQKDQ